LNELIISLENTSVSALWGVNNENFTALKQFFPKLKLVTRGSLLKAYGNDGELIEFEKTFLKIKEAVNKYNKLESKILEEIVGQTEVAEKAEAVSDKDDVIVYGSKGNTIKARTANQLKMVKSADHNDIIFAIGPAGTGKTYTAVAMAVRALKNKQVKRIVLTRPAVEAGENLGFLPGDLKDKIDPYLRPLYDALDDMIQPEKLKYYLENRIIEIAPLAFMRGRTLDHAFVILDEAQNTTDLQLKMFLTRMGPDAKFVLTGDITQIDLPLKQQSGLVNAVNILDKIKGIDIIKLTASDVVRHKLVAKIIKAYS
jgi:phosphate starvation-inducible PhoH-like protein